MNKVTEERRRELGERLFEIGKELEEMRIELGANSVGVSAAWGGIWSHGFFGTTEEGAGGIQLDGKDESVKDTFVKPSRTLDVCSVETLEKAHECFGWNFPNGEVEE